MKQTGSEAPRTTSNHVFRPSSLGKRPLLTRGDHDFRGNLADCLTANDPPPVPYLVAASRARVDFAHGVYFCGESSKDSFSGHVDGQQCIQEKGITDFVRYGHPDLYKKLGKMPLESGHLGDDSGEAFGANHDCYDSSCGSSPETTSVVATSEDGVISAANKAEAMDVDCPNELDDMPQAQEHLLPANTAQLPVYCHCQRGMLFFCGAASCGFVGNVIPEGNFFTLANGAWYCLDCARNL